MGVRGNNFTGEQLSLMPVDAGDLDLHPVVSPLVVEIQSAFKFDETRDLSEPSSRARRLASRYKLDDNALPAAAAALFLEQDKIAAPLIFSRQLLRPHFGAEALRQGTLDQTLASCISSVVRVVRQVEKATFKVIPNLTIAAAGDSELGFGLLKLLSTPPPEEVSDTGQIDVGQAVAAMAAVEHFSPRRTGNSLITSLVEWLDAGRFNPYLARELIDTFRSDQTDPASQARVQDFERVVSLLSMGGLSEKEAETAAYNNQIVALWSTRLAASLTSTREGYKQSLEKRLAQRKRWLEDNVVVLPSAPEQAFNSGMQTMLRRLGLAYGHASSKSAAKAEQARMRYGASANGRTAPATPEYGNLRDEPRELRFIDAQGRFYEPTEGEVPGCILDYVRKSAGGDKTLIPKIEGVIETLQLLDLSREIQAGAIPHARNFNIGGRNVGTLWQIRTDRIPNSKNLGPHTKKLRIFCTLDHSMLGIYKLMDKKDVLPWKRGQGIAGATRRGK